MRKSYAALSLLLLIFNTVTWCQSKALLNVSVPPSLANAKKIDLKYTGYYTLGYEPLVGSPTVEASSWDGYTDKIRVTLVMRLQFSSPTKYVIYKEGKGQVKAISGLPDGDVQLSALSVHVPVSYNGNSLGTPVFQFGFDKFNNLVASEYVYIPTSLLKNYDKVGTATKIAGGGKEATSELFQGMAFGIPKISHFDYFMFLEDAVAQAGKLSDIELAARRKEADDQKKADDAKKAAEDLKKQQAVDAAAKKATAADNSAKTSVTSTGSRSASSSASAASSTRSGVGSGSAPASAASASAASAAAAQNAAAGAAAQQQIQRMTDNFVNQQKEQQRKSDEFMALSMQTFYAAEAVRNGKANLSNLSSLSGNHSSIEELEAEFNEKYRSINAEVESLNEARDAQLQASYNQFASGASESDKAIGQAAVAIGGLVNSMKADKEKREAREALQRARTQAKAEIEAKRRAMIVSLRNSYFAQFPDGGVPLSSHKVTTDELYFFSYVCDKEQVGSSYAVISVSNVFPIARYGDGTWPFKTSVVGDIRKTGAQGGVTLVGYYASKEMAEQMRRSFVGLAGKCQFGIKDIAYKGKKSGGGNAADFWGNTTGKKAAKDSTTTIGTATKTNKDQDFWQTGAKKASADSSSKRARKDDFWNN